MERRGRLDRRARLIAAARVEFAQNGYHGTSIDRIIERAEVARATFYLHFKSKRTIFEAVLEELVALVYQSLPPVDPGEAVAPQVLHNVEHGIAALMDGDLARMLLLEGIGPDEASREKLRRLQERLVQYAEETLSLGQQLGIIRQGDVRVMGAALIGTVKEVLYQHVTGLRTRADLDSFPREILLTVLTGIGEQHVASDARLLGPAGPKEPAAGA